MRSDTYHEIPQRASIDLEYGRRVMPLHWGLDLSKVLASKCRDMQKKKKGVGVVKTVYKFEANTDGRKTCV